MPTPATAKSFEEHVASRTPKREKKLASMTIAPADNGHVVEHRFQDSRGKKGDYMPAPEPERHVFATAEQVAHHVHKTLGGKGKLKDHEPDADD